MKISPWAFGLLTSLTFSLPTIAATPKIGRNLIALRGREVEIYFYPAAKDSGAAKGKILYTPGNAGMKRMAIDMAQRMAAWGYDVYGLEVKNYLESFTSAETKLKATEVMSDYREIAQWLTAGNGEPVLLVGWSQGASMNLLAGAPPENKKIFSGLICIGLGPEAVLGWKFADNFADAFKRMPDEPKFRAVDYLPKIGPLPFYMIQSRQDEWVTAEQTKEMFALAPAPKKIVLIQAENHHFKNNVAAFYSALHEGLEWIKHSQ